MGNKTKGLLALLGLGALAFWRYKKASPEEQQAIKDKLNMAKDNLNKFGNNLKTKAEELKAKAEVKINEITSANEKKY